MATRPAVMINPKPAYKAILEEFVSPSPGELGAVGVRVWAVMAGVVGTLVGMIVSAAAGTVFVGSLFTGANPVVGLGAGVSVMVGSGKQ